MHMGRITSFRVEYQGRIAAHGTARVARASVEDTNGPLARAAAQGRARLQE